MTGSPCRSRSSAVLTTTARSPAGTISCNPRASFAPPVPPARTTVVTPCAAGGIAATGAATGGPSIDVIDDPRGPNAEADALLSQERVSDHALGLARFVGVVSAGHPRDVGLGSPLVLDRRRRPGDAHPVIAVLIGDRQRDPRIAEEV